MTEVNIAAGIALVIIIVSVYQAGFSNGRLEEIERQRMGG